MLRLRHSQHFTLLTFNQNHNCIPSFAHTEEHTETYYLNLQLYLALSRFTVRFSSLFSCAGYHFTVLVHSHRSWSVFGRRRPLYSVKKALKPFCTQLSTAKRDKVNDWLVNYI